MDGLLNSLTEKESSLVREVEPDRLATLDEDTLIDLHTRVRRARDKHVKVYRRQAAAEVMKVGGRGKAHAVNARRRAKAEVFEQALAEVSQQLAEVARSSAETLKSERLEAEAPAGTGRPSRPAILPRSQTTDRRLDSPALRKRHASTRAAGARRQARKDNR